MECRKSNGPVAEVETKKQKSRRDQRQLTRIAEDNLKVANLKPADNIFAFAPKDRRVAKELNAALNFGHAIADRKEKLVELGMLLSFAADDDKKQLQDQITALIHTARPIQEVIVLSDDDVEVQSNIPRSATTSNASRS